jgi:hypothetical protein
MRCWRCASARQCCGGWARCNLAIIQGSEIDGPAGGGTLKIGGIAQLGERLHGMQEVIGSIPFTSTKVLTLSSRGLGHYPFTVSTGVRIPVGSPSLFLQSAMIARSTRGTSRQHLARKGERAYQEW